MRLPTSIIILALIASTACAAPLWRLAPSNLGDASFGRVTAGAITNYQIANATLPAGTHDGITITGWYRHTYTNFALTVCPMLNYTPLPVQYSNPDLLGGAWAHGIAGGTNLTASPTEFASFPFSTYTNHPTITNSWPKGIYTVSGWASNAVTLSLAGATNTFGPGAFTRNVTPGISNNCTLTGTGLVSIGISQTPCYRFFNTPNGYSNDNAVVSIITTNGLVFMALSLAADGTNHTSMVSIRTANGSWISSSQTIACADRFSSGGIYQLFMTGYQNSPNKSETRFDFRVFHWRLSADDLERIYQNGKQEAYLRNLF
jgi:hypothetical protein